MNPIRIGILGYGNLGRGIELAVAANDDMELVGVFTRRDPASVHPLGENVAVWPATELAAHTDDIDVLMLAGGSATDLPEQTPAAAALYNVVDSFDTHANIPAHFAAVDAVARETGHVAVISVGWDPGMFSVSRVYANAIMPNGADYTFWGRGVSQGHSDAIRRIPGVVDAVESKVFGIGAESYTVGSNEFYMGYATSRQTALCLDAGHFHPTEVISDKISAAMLYIPRLLLHVSRPVRWDSDHVVLFDDETKELCKEIVRCGGLDGRVYLALDYFDASVNRIAAWVTGFRNVQKALLNALLTPDMTAEQNAGNFTDLLVRQEELKTMPFGEVWAEYCRRCGVPEDGAWLPLVWAYEKNVLEARA